MANIGRKHYQWTKELDQRLRTLALDPKMSYTALAKELSMSTPAIARRLSKLGIKREPILIEARKHRTCLRCGVLLTPENWHEFSRERYNNVCAFCHNKESNEKAKHLRKKAVDRLGGVCECCSKDDINFLEVHHKKQAHHYVNRRKGIVKEGIPLYLAVINSNNPKEEFSLYCASCHFSITHFGGCPHIATEPTLLQKRLTNLNPRLPPRHRKEDLFDCSSCGRDLRVIGMPGGIKNRPRKLFICKDCYHEKVAISHLKKKIETLDQYGGACVLCGESDKHFLTIDHTFCDGALHRKELKKKSIYQWLKENSYPKDRFRCLCANCQKLEYRRLKRAA